MTDAFGTVRYSSPEMAADSGIGQKTDVWSAGALMYFMLSGKAPFLKKDDLDTLDYIKNKPKVRQQSSDSGHLPEARPWPRLGPGAPGGTPWL